MLGAHAERLLRLGCVDVSQANLVLPLVSVEDRERVAVCIMIRILDAWGCRKKR